MALRFLTFTFWNSYVLKLLRLETLTFSDVTVSDINVVWCYVLSQYRQLSPFKVGSKQVWDTGPSEWVRGEIWPHLVFSLPELAGQLQMSCSADHYLEWNSQLDSILQTNLNGRFSATQNHKKMRENILLLTLEALTSRCYQHWQHRLFGANYALQYSRVFSTD